MIDVKTYRYSHPEAGSEVARSIRVGRLHVTVAFARGVYGFRHTPSFKVVVWVA